MKTKLSYSYNIQIWCGLKIHNTGYIYSLLDVESFIQKHADELGECVTITPTKFIYTKGNENGVVIGYINYLRFPKEKEILKSRALELAEKMLIYFNQSRISITCPDETFMLTNNELVDEES